MFKITKYINVALVGASSAAAFNFYKHESETKVGQIDAPFECNMTVHSPKGSLDYYREVLQVHLDDFTGKSQLCRVDTLNRNELELPEVHEVQLTAYEKAHQASMHPDLLPIPEYVMNDAIRSWEPTDEAAFYYPFSNGDYENLIIHDSVELREREARVVADFAEWRIKHGKAQLPQFSKNHDDLRFWLSHKQDFAQAYEGMLAYDKLSNEYLIPLFEQHAKFEAFLQEGVIYGFHRDNQNRPVIIYNVRKALDKNMSMDAFLDVLDYILAYTKHHAMIPGKIETVNLVVDNGGVALYEFPISDLMAMTKRMIASQKVFTNQIICVNTHWLLKRAGQIINTFCDPRIMGKVFVFTDNGHQHLGERIGQDQLEQKFGGNLPNRETDFFPPRYNP